MARQGKKPQAAFNPKSEKRPAIGFSPSFRKVPAIGVTASPNSESPAWRIGRMELVDPFGWHILDAAKLDEIREKLSQFEAKSWNDILVAEKHRNHTVSANEICKDARDRLAALRLDDIDQLISLRLTGAGRVWGFRIGLVLHLLWWDPDHLVYPSPLRNT